MVFTQTVVMSNSGGLHIAYKRVGNSVLVFSRAALTDNECKQIEEIVGLDRYMGVSEAKHAKSEFLTTGVFFTKWCVIERQDCDWE